MVLRSGQLQSEHFYEARSEVLRPDCPTRRLEFIVRIVVTSLGSIDGGKERIPRVHLDAAFALLDRYDKESLLYAAQHFEMARNHLAQEEHTFAETLVKEAVAFSKLAEIGHNVRQSAKRSMLFARQGRSMLLKGDPVYAEAFMVEGSAWLHIALGRMSLSKNLARSIRACRRAKQLFDEIEGDRHDAAAARVHEAIARSTAAEFGFKSVSNFRRAAQLFRDARNIYGSGSLEYAGLLTNEGAVLIHLAILGHRPLKRLTRAVRLYRESRRILCPDMPGYEMQYARALGNEARAKSELARLGKEPIRNLENSICLCRGAKGRLNRGSRDRVLVILTEAEANLMLSEYHPVVEDYLRATVELCQEAFLDLHVQSPDYRKALELESLALLGLMRFCGRSDWELEYGSKLKQSIQVLEKAYQFQLTDAGRAQLLLTEANAQHMLGYAAIFRRPDDGADLQLVNQQVKDYLETAVLLYGKARNFLTENRALLASTLSREARARMTLADWKIEATVNLTTAASLLEQAQRLLEVEVGSKRWCEILAHRALALRQLGHLHDAYRLLQDSLDHLENLRSGIRDERDRIVFFEQFWEPLFPQFALVPLVTSVSPQ